MKTQVTEQKMRVPCETHTCRNRAAYKIGNPKFPHSCHNVCEDCMKEIVASLPKELLEKEVKVYDCEPVPLEKVEGQKETTSIGESMTMNQLRALAKQREIKVAANVTKPELLKVLGV